MSEHVCPVWVGYLLASPVRKLFQNPKKRLSPYVTRGMTVLDIGSAMGFFSLPMAGMVGSEGRVICVDMQEKMLTSLSKRARKAGFEKIISCHLCTETSLQLSEYKDEVDFALASAVIHEVPDAAILLSEVADAMKADSQVLISEPKGHVPAEAFETTLSIAKQQGFELIRQSVSRFTHEAHLRKK